MLGPGSDSSSRQCNPSRQPGLCALPPPSHRSGSTAAGIGRKEDGDPGAGITPSHTIYWEALNQTLGHR